MQNQFFSKYLLISILVFAFIFRTIGLFWGLAIFDDGIGKRGSYHPDEYKVILPRTELLLFDVMSRTDLRYPTAMHYTIAIIAWPTDLLKDNISKRNYVDVRFLVGRSVSLIYGVLAVYATFVLGKKVLNNRSGLIAASLLAICIYHVRNSSLATIDVSTSFWICVFLYLVERFNVQSNWKDALLLSVSLGILVGTKYTGAIAILPALIIIFNRFKLDSKRVNLKIHLPLIVLSLIVSLATFIITTPSALIRPEALISSLLYESARVSSRQIPLLEALLNPALFINSLTLASNYIIAFTFIGSLIITLIRKHNISLIAYVLTIITFCLYFNSALITRYWILLLPLVCILIASMIDFGLALQTTGAKYISAFILMMCLLNGIFQVYQLSKLLWHDTRSQASLFIRSLPANDQIAFGEQYIYASAGGGFYPFSWGRGARENEIPDWFVFSSFETDFYKDEFLFTDIKNKEYSYRLIKKFIPINNLKIEFLSPEIRFYKLISP